MAFFSTAGQSMSPSIKILSGYSPTLEVPPFNMSEDGDSIFLSAGMLSMMHFIRCENI